MVKKCERCGILWEDTDERCDRCGRELGKLTASVDSEPSQEFSVKSILYSLLCLVPGVVRWKVVALSILTFAVAAAGMGMAVVLAGLGAALTAFTIGGGALVLYWTCWGWLMYGEICTPTEALADLRGTQWFVLLLVTVVPFGLVVWIMQQAAG